MNLFVSNLHPDTKADGLRTLFSDFGEVVSSKVIFDSATGASRGFGFVEMGDRNQSHDAIDNLDMSFFEGNIINVKEAKQSGTGNSKPGGYNSKPGGYNNNRSGGGGYGNSRPGGGYNNNNNSNRSSSYSRPQTPRYTNNNSGNWGNNNSSYNSNNNSNKDEDNFNKL